jgi:uncharacterized protein (TIGR03067 family)
MKSVLLTALALAFAVSSAALLGADDEDKDKAIKKDRKLYEGTWRVVSLTVDGNEFSAEDAKKFTVVNGADGSWTILHDGKELSKGASEIDPTKKPKTIDAKPSDGGDAGKVARGIYEIEKDTRKVCFGKADGERPTEFASKNGTGVILATFKREKK